MKCTRTGCPNEVDKSHPKANHKKYCSKQCQNLHYKEVNAERIKAVTNRLNHAKYDKYEQGKERCIICDGWYWSVCQHAVQRHKISAKDYKRMIGADVGKGRIPKRLKRLKREYVFENGTVENLKKGAHMRYKKGDTRAGRYERSEETMARLKKQFHKKT